MATIKRAKKAPFLKSALPEKAAVTAKVTPERSTEKAEAKASKYKGATTGLRVMEYQDSTFAANGKAMLTDAELAADWRREFPQAVTFTENHVKGARRDYNAGRHSKAFAAKKPATPLAEVVMADGKRAFVTEAEPVAKTKKTATPEPTKTVAVESSESKKRRAARKSA